MDQGKQSVLGTMMSALHQSLLLSASLRRQTVPEVVDAIKRSIMEQGPDPEIISDFVRELDAVAKLYSN